MGVRGILGSFVLNIVFSNLNPPSETVGLLEIDLSSSRIGSFTTYNDLRFLHLLLVPLNLILNDWDYSLSSFITFPFEADHLI